MRSTSDRDKTHAPPRDGRSGNKGMNILHSLQINRQNDESGTPPCAHACPCKEKDQTGRYLHVCGPAAVTTRTHSPAATTAAAVTTCSKAWHFFLSGCS